LARTLPFTVSSFGYCFPWSGIYFLAPGRPAVFLFHSFFSKDQWPLFCPPLFSARKGPCVASPVLWMVVPSPITLFFFLSGGSLDFPTDFPGCPTRTTPPSLSWVRPPLLFWVYESLCVSDPPCPVRRYLSQWTSPVTIFPLGECVLALSVVFTFSFPSLWTSLP